MISVTSTRIDREIARQAGLARDVARTQIEIATGKKLLARSDAPAASAQVSSLRRQSADTAAWQSNIDTGLARNAQADTVLRDVSDRLTRARQLIVAGANGTAAPADRNVIAAELDAIAAEVAGFAATDGGDGRALFAAGPVAETRFGSQTVFAPVVSREVAFDNGNYSGVLRDAAIALRAGNATAVASSVDAIGLAVSRAADIAADIGTRGARLSALREQMTNAEIDRSGERSGLEDVDLSEAIARLNQQMLTLEAARAAFARVNRETLFDILR